MRKQKMQKRSVSNWNYELNVMLAVLSLVESLGCLLPLFHIFSSQVHKLIFYQRVIWLHEHLFILLFLIFFKVQN